MKYLAALVLLVLSMSQAYAIDCGGGVVVREFGPTGGPWDIGCVGSVAALLTPVSPGSPVTVTNPDTSDTWEFPIYDLSDADTCSTSESARQSGVQAALQASGYTVRLFSFEPVYLADGNVDVWTRTGGPAPNYWALTYTTCP